MYACESNVVTPSKVDPNCVPTSVVVEKPTGEFGVKCDACTLALVVALPDLSAVIVLPVASCVGSSES